ncbi:MAG TPA: hypothetical protein VFJ70_14650 [Burkholderiales bacterium]|nr:hypothetical protein [Burkholderiales bacterium]
MGRTTALHQAVRSRRQARASRLAEVDRLKEQVAYFKLWQGVVVVTDISVAGWLISGSDAANRWAIGLAVAGVALMSTVIIGLHRHIGSRIRQLSQP